MTRNVDNRLFTCDYIEPILSSSALQTRGDPLVQDLFYLRILFFPFFRTFLILAIVTIFVL